MSFNGQRVVALLPMKARSERVPGKNFRDFCGKPLFCWVLDTLLSCDAIDQVVINTDARHLIGGSSLDSRRVIIRDRAAELCGDLVSMNKILDDDIKHVEADIYLMTHTTNPLLSGATVQRALQAFWNASSSGAANSLFTVNKLQTRLYRADASAVNHDPLNLIRTQDLEPWFEENSNLYLFTRDSFAETGARIGSRPVMHEMPRIESIDIDTQDDWDFAEIAARQLRERGSGVE